MYFKLKLILEKLLEKIDDVFSLTRKFMTVQELYEMCFKDEEERNNLFILTFTRGINHIIDNNLLANLKRKKHRSRKKRETKYILFYDTEATSCNLDKIRLNPNRNKSKKR